MDLCTDYHFLEGILIVKNVLFAAIVVIPCVLIIVSSIDAFKGILKGDAESTKNIFIMLASRLAAVVIIFCLPSLINIVFGMFDGVGVTYSSLAENISTCYENADSSVISSLKNVQEQLDEANQESTTEYYADFAIDRSQSSDTDSTTLSTDVEDRSTSTNAKIFVGDSRMSGLCTAVTSQANCEYSDVGVVNVENEYYIAQSSMGYNWLKSTALSAVNTILSENPSTKFDIFINLGVNDLYQQTAYSALYTSLINGDWSSQNVFIVSLTPVDEALTSSLTNASIILFNDTLSAGISSNYCDIYDRVNASFNTTDGVHYDEDTYKNIYTLMKNCS